MELQINADKTEMVILTKKFTMNRIIVPLKINNVVIKPKTSIKYLGVVLDARLSFKLHITHMLQKTFIAMQSLYALLAPNSALSPTNKRTIYLQIIRPIIAYAAPVWCRASKAQYNRIQRIQNKFLRCITSAGRYTKIVDLHAMANVPRVDEYIGEISDRFFRDKIQASQLTENLTGVRHNDNPTHKPIYARLPLYFED